MSLKSVEMQIAVPRTTEASKIQQEHHQRPSQDQTLLAGEHMKQSRQAAQRSTEVSETAESAIRDDGSRQAPEDGGHSSEQKEHSAERPAEHPYKGRSLDISL
ncbi:hypothetical protein SAMN05661091_2041 [Paenibacillus uliginis N3/975]|uniref:Uncharacterized protein n=1 Tax=Paenibacillus uliginis N3/975 TaxID=1313296 RepID=A0A1X7H9Y2_9BACL|nr:MULTISPECIES: hypothetical protein [Paenibacillus]UNK16682.1 hypothetical protein MNQ98_19550 [Paenibacillus sp. N3/727]SMF81751.1 hypothetical protein SAMN05661091_2041 [Paenibacillus uliginis N3/975]